MRLRWMLIQFGRTLIRFRRMARNFRRMARNFGRILLQMSWRAIERKSTANFLKEVGARLAMSGAKHRGFRAVSLR